MKWDFSKPLLDLRGNKVLQAGRSVTVGERLAEFISIQTEVEPFAGMFIADALIKEEPIELGVQAFNLLVDLIQKDSKTLTVLVKKQILDIFGEYGNAINEEIARAKQEAEHPEGKNDGQIETEVAGDPTQLKVVRDEEEPAKEELPVAEAEVVN